MNKYLLTFLISFYICIFLLCIYYINKLVKNFINIKNAISFTLKNNYICEEEECLTCDDKGRCIYKIVDLKPPTEIPKTWNKIIHQYCGNLVNRLEYGITNVLPYPPNLKILLKLYNKKNEPIFGLVGLYKDVIWIFFRGTITDTDLKFDLERKQTDFMYEKIMKNKKEDEQESLSFLNVNGIKPNVHKGFLDAYLNFRDEILNVLKNNSFTKIVVTGHSFGSGVATIIGLDLVFQKYDAIVYNFASPRVGDKLFSNQVNTYLPLFRLVNTCDIIPTVPYSVSANYITPKYPFYYEHCGKAIYFTDNLKSILNNHLIHVYLNNLDKIPVDFIV
jgi:hypothetical protein